ncbi:TRAP transporter small permease [Mesobacterium pallidum]|uniref:TRAP transporter small permease n=1 Tax=Mesobacterium pallidum TaxID=2872037 RepID=UPI001EE32993|nr:TRAP transporter small permease subunit [Mesobacterium pallidum]
MRKFSEQALEALSAAALVFLMLLVVVDVGMRDFLHRPLLAGTELTELAMGFMAFAAVPLLTLRGKHINVELFRTAPGTLANSLQRIVENGIGLVIYGVMIAQIKVFADRTARSGENLSELGLGMTWVWWGMFVFTVLLLLACLVVIVDEIIAIARRGRGVAR